MNYEQRFIGFSVIHQVKMPADGGERAQSSSLCASKQAVKSPSACLCVITVAIVLADAHCAKRLHIQTSLKVDLLDLEICASPIFRAESKNWL